jgi:hypothetical protein
MTDPNDNTVPEAALVLRRAEELVAGARRDDYGPAEESFAALGELWGVLLHVEPLTGTQVAICLAALKLWRCTTSPGQFDSWVDLAGYAALGWQCAVSAAR